MTLYIKNKYKKIKARTNVFNKTDLSFWKYYLRQLFLFGVMCVSVSYIQDNCMVSLCRSWSQIGSRQPPKLTLKVQVGPHQHKINLIASVDVISLST